MPYFWLPVDHAPYPHGMRPIPGCPFSLDALRRSGQFGVDRDPAPGAYRRLYADPAFRQRASRCSVHRGDWERVIPIVASFLADTPDDLDPEQIADRFELWPAIKELGEDDRHLAIALLHWYEPIEIARPYQPRLWAGSGQHRLCGARLAGAERVPVWCRPGEDPPPGAVPAQLAAQRAVQVSRCAGRWWPGGGWWRRPARD